MFESLKQKFFGNQYYEGTNQWGNVLTKRNIAGLLVVLFLLITIPIGIYVVQQRTNLNPKADVTPTMSILGLAPNPDGGPGITTTGNLSLELKPGGGATAQNVAQSEGQQFGSYLEDQNPRCEVDASCSGAQCTFKPKFYLNGELQNPQSNPSQNYAFTVTPNAGDSSAGTGSIGAAGQRNIVSGWRNYLDPALSGGVGAIKHNYGNVSEGPFNVEISIGKALPVNPKEGETPSTEWITSCRARVLTPASIAGGTGADIGYDCQRTCNGQIKVHTYQDITGPQGQGGPDGKVQLRFDKPIPGAKVKIETTNNERGEVNMTRFTEGANGMTTFTCIPSKNPPVDDNASANGITYKVTLESLPSPYTLSSPKVYTGVNLDSCNDTDTVNFAIP